jgi:hypothetical protein
MFLNIKHLKSFPYYTYIQCNVCLSVYVVDFNIVLYLVVRVEWCVSAGWLLDSLYVKYPTLLLDFKETWILWTDLRKIFRY